MLKNRLYNQAIHKFHINDAKNPDTISNNGNIGLDDPESAFSDKDHQIAVKIINSNQEIMHHTMSYFIKLLMINMLRICLRSIRVLNQIYI